MTTAIRSEATRSVMVVNGVDRLALNDDGSVEILSPVANPTGNQVLTAAQVSDSVSGSSGEVVLTGSTVDIPIPAGVKQITCGIFRLSISGDDSPILRLGTSGGIVVSGYLGANEGAGGITSATDHLVLARSNVAANRWSGTLSLTRIGLSDKWSMTSAVYDNGACRYAGSSVAIGGELTTLRFMVNGPSIFDGGSVSISYVW